jgi:isochorismate hydrolase
MLEKMIGGIRKKILPCLLAGGLAVCSGNAYAGDPLPLNDAQHLQTSRGIEEKAEEYKNVTEQMVPTLAVPPQQEGPTLAPLPAKPELTIEEQIKRLKTDYAVLLIDMQEKFLEDIDEEEKKKEIPLQIEILEHAQRSGMPIYLLEYAHPYYGDDGPTHKDLMAVLNRGEYETIKKTHDDGFIGTGLNDSLKKRGIETVILMGINASACVMRTGKGALWHGYEIMTSPDVIADPCHCRIGESLWFYEREGKLFKSHEELIDFLRSDALAIQYLEDNPQLADRFEELYPELREHIAEKVYPKLDEFVSPKPKVVVEPEKTEIPQEKKTESVQETPKTQEKIPGVQEPVKDWPIQQALEEEIIQQEAHEAIHEMQIATPEIIIQFPPPPIPVPEEDF